MRRTNKKLLEKQIDVFIEWATRHGVGSTDYTEWLYEFKIFTDKVDVCDVRDEDVESFMNHIYNKTNGAFRLRQAKIAIQSFTRFYSARGKNGIRRNVMGRPRNISQIEKAKKYRKQGLSYRDIGKLLQSDVSQVHRWIKYPDLEKEEK